jgi:hypothetical protein
VILTENFDAQLRFPDARQDSLSGIPNIPQEFVNLFSKGGGFEHNRAYFRDHLSPLSQHRG